ncbi:tetratricopeptide repeat protein [Nonomuraea sp. NBC_01738]|uniref:AfsR/SARP family transcriptional regulator n=1 Tax=Nonomuraea sp. NBC_01738 TaxID=2976003 RepID=UPI002E11713D|nr:tetratricopeptide repeat protein [Nonomuraea sp. NBC_01738]
MLSFTLLGPVRLLADGVPLTGLAPRHRAVLGYLLLNAGRVISMERLIDAMWGYDQPDTARSQIHASITAIRRTLRAAGADGLLETRAGGYVVSPAPDRLDIRRFTDLVAAGELRRALDLWSGEALADLSAHYVEGARALWHDRRLSACERLAEAELAAGRHRELADELAELVAADPLRERLNAALVLALHRSGRQADALASARAYRTALADEQGLDPGHAFAELEQAVLADDPALSPVTAPAEARPHRSNYLPFDLPDFSGRTAELEHLAGGQGTLVTIDGMAGVGKTALAVHVAHRLADRYPDGQVFIDLRAHTGGQRPIDTPAALETLLRQLGVPAERVPATADERGALWRAELTGRRVLVVLDNAHDAEHVRPLLPGVSDSLILVTSRRRLVELAGAQTLSVGVLAESDAVALFESIVGARAVQEPEAVRQALELCGLLPLAIRVAAARLQHRPSWTVAYLADRLRDHHKLLDGVSAAFALSYEQVSEAEQRLFRLLGLAPGRDIDAYGAAALAGLSDDEAEDLLESLLDAHMLLQREPGRYTMHDLLRGHARSLTPAGDEEALTRLLLYYLHRSHRAMDHLFPHSVRQRAGIPAPASPIAPIRDAEQAIGWLDAERANIIETAVHGPEVCLGFLGLAMRPYLERQAHHDDAVRLHDLVLRRSRVTGNREAEARAHSDLGLAYWRLGAYEQAQEHAGQALELCEEPYEQARALLTLGNVALRRRNDEQAERHLSRALDLSRVGADTWGEAHVLGALAVALQRNGSPADARRHLDVALALHRKVGNPAGEALVLNQLGVVLRQQGELGLARARHEQAAALYRALGNPADEAAALNGLAEAAADAGRAVTEHTAALTLAGASGNRPESARAHDGLALAHRRLGDHDAARAHGEAALSLYAELSVPEAGEVRAFLDELVAPR